LPTSVCREKFNFHHASQPRCACATNTSSPGPCSQFYTSGRTTSSRSPSSSTSGGEAHAHAQVFKVDCLCPTRDPSGRRGCSSWRPLSNLPYKLSPNSAFTSLCCRSPDPNHRCPSKRHLSRSHREHRRENVVTVARLDCILCVTVVPVCAGELLLAMPPLPASFHLPPSERRYTAEPKSDIAFAVHLV
jgi:hypothetical protein